MAGLQGAVESAAPVSRLHERHSADLADFPVPTGREEEWRFTPLRRLRGLHGGALVNAAAAEALTSVLIFLNRFYKVDGAGIRITGTLIQPEA